MEQEDTKARRSFSDGSDEVIAACIEVHRHLGPGLLESAYEASLCHELRLRGLAFERQKRVPLVYKGVALDCGFALDVLVEGRILVEIKAVEHLLAVHKAQLITYLKLAGISQGVGSAREIARLTVTDAAYRWVVGDLEVSHHALSAFRVGHGEALNTLMTDVLASLVHKGVLSLRLVAQDGIRVRAWASAPSFRSYGSLMACRQQAALHLKAVLAAADDPESSVAQKAAREAAARDFQKRVEEAIATVNELQKSRRDDKPARASTTDPEARVMKMADGGFRPAYNVRMATAGSEMGGPRTIVGVQVTNVGSDMGSIRPMLDEIEERVGALPRTLLADANHAAHDCIRDATRRDVQLLVAVPERSKDSGPNAATDAAVAEWRNRMQSERAQELYRARAGLCELMNAHLRSHHGVNQFLVRGLGKVTCVALLAALASNLLQHAPTLLV